MSWLHTLETHTEAGAVRAKILIMAQEQSRDYQELAGRPGLSLAEQAQLMRAADEAIADGVAAVGGDPSEMMTDLQQYWWWKVEAEAAPAPADVRSSWLMTPALVLVSLLLVLGTALAFIAI